MTLVTGTYWKQSSITVLIIDKTHDEYKKWRKTSNYDKTGEVLYLYIKGHSIKNKIGSFREVKNFLQVFNGPYNNPV